MLRIHCSTLLFTSTPPHTEIFVTSWQRFKSLVKQFNHIFVKRRRRRGGRKEERKKKRNKERRGERGSRKKVRMHFGPLMQFLLVTNSAVMKKCKYLQMQKMNFCHSRIFEHVPSWNKRIDVDINYVKKLIFWWKKLAKFYTVRTFHSIFMT